MPSLDPVLAVLERLYPDPTTWSKPFRRLAAVRSVRNGAAIREAARSANSTVKTIQRLLTADPVATMFGASYANVDSHDGGKAWKLAKRGIGQILLGRVAERAFEQLYRRELGTDDLKLEDSRDERNDTDYRVLNGGGKPVFRINIKMHGTPFRRAQELVGLRPDDCFALGTYKILQGLNKEAAGDVPPAVEIQRRLS